MVGHIGSATEAQQVLGEGTGDVAIAGRALLRDPYCLESLWQLASAVPKNLEGIRWGVETPLQWGPRLHYLKADVYGNR